MPLHSKLLPTTYMGELGATVLHIEELKWVTYVQFCCWGIPLWGSPAYVNSQATEALSCPQTRHD
eukprot:4513903-Alexandrium_andersonii.AAC.1